MSSPNAEDLIVRLSGGLHPADRDAFRRAAEAAVNSLGECWGEGLVGYLFIEVVLQWHSAYQGLGMRGIVKSGPAPLSRPTPSSTTSANASATG